MSELNPLVRWLLFIYYIAIGSAQILIVKLTMEGGKIRYNTWSAIMLVEAGKFMVSDTVERILYADERRENAKNPITWKGWAWYSGPSLLYAILNNVTIYATSMLNPHVFALFSNMKLAFAALLTRMLLNKKFTIVQWVSISLLMLCLVVSKIDMFIECPKEGAGASGVKQRLLLDDERLYSMSMEYDFDLASNSLQENFEALQGYGKRFLLVSDSDLSGAGAEDAEAAAAAKWATFVFGFMLCVLSSFLSGFSGVVNEWLLKKWDLGVNMWQKNKWTYQWGIMFNLGGMAMNMLFTSSSAAAAAAEQAPGLLGLIFQGYNFYVCLLIVANIALGTSVSLILRYFDNVVKGFGFTLIIFCVTLYSWLFLSIEVNVCFFTAILIYACSSYLYVADFNNVLLKLEAEWANEHERLMLKGQKIGADGRSTMSNDPMVGESDIDDLKDLELNEIDPSKRPQE